MNPLDLAKQLGLDATYYPFAMLHPRDALKQTTTPSPAPTNGELLTLEQAAKILGYKPAGLRKVVKRGEIRHLQIGRGPIKFRREWLDEFIVANRVSDTENTPAQKRNPFVPVATTGTNNHGFDPSLYA